MDYQMTRRNMLKGSLGLAGALALRPGRLFAAGAGMPVGIQQFAVMEDYRKDAAGTLAALAKAGFSYIECFADIIGDHATFRRMLADNGLTCPLGHFPFAMKDADEVLDQAASMGVTWAISSVLTPEALGDAPVAKLFERLNGLGKDDFHRIAQRANDIGRKAKAHGLRYAYHNHNIEFRAFDGGETGYSILLKETDPELVHFEADVGWMTVGGANPLEILKASPARFAQMHFKDFSAVKPPETVLGGSHGQQIVNLGTGVVDFKPVVAAARRAGMKYFIVDHDPPFRGQTAFEAVRADHDALAALLAG